MKLVMILNLFLIPYAFSQEEASDIQYLSACHKELEETLPCEPAGTLEISNVGEIAKVLEVDEFLRYKEREKSGVYNEFLKACTGRKARFHEQMRKLALEAYDISFLNRNEPNLENTRDGKAPEGYAVGKYYGHNPEACFQTGFKAAMFTANSGDHVVFAITGTEGSDNYSSGKKRETYISTKSSGFLGLGGSAGNVVVSAKDKDKEDWMPTTGRKQFSSSCAKQMIKDAVKLAKEQNKKIVFTGHSLGGALSQALSYEVQSELIKENIDAPPVESVTFMAAGGAALVRNDEKTGKRLRSTSYISLGDMVSGFGNHIGEIREMVRTPEYEKKFEDMKLSAIETHTLTDEFLPLEKSINLKGADINKRMCGYWDHLKQCQLNKK